jgi:hypothetical protein
MADRRERVNINAADGEVLETDEAGGRQVEVTDEELVEALTSLAELDSEAAAAYALGAQAADDRELIRRLEEFGRDHLRHVDQLNELIENAGGEAVDAADYGDQGLLLRLAETAAVAGERGLVTAMIGNEMLSNGAYETALSLDCGDEARVLLEHNRADERRHLAWLMEARQRLGVELPVVLSAV